MSRFCELNLVDIVTRTKMSNKKKQNSSENDILETNPKINRTEKFFSNTSDGNNMPTVTEKLRNKSKSRGALRTSKRMKLNTSVEAIESNEDIKLCLPKFDCQKIKRLVSGRAEKNMSKQIKPKTYINIDNKHINYNEDIIRNAQKKKSAKCKTHHKFWGSNLIGARRVSKRLKKLKFKSNNSNNSVKTTEKYIFSNTCVSHMNLSNLERRERTQKSVFMNVSTKELKMNRKNTVKKQPLTKKEPKEPPKNGRLCRKRQLHPKIDVNKQNVVLKIPNFNTTITNVSNELCDPEPIFKSNPIFCGSESNKLSIPSTSISAISKSGSYVEKVSGSSVELEEGVNVFVETDIETQKIKDLYPSIEDDVLSENKIDISITNSKDIVTVDQIHEECEENAEIIIVDIEAEQGEPSCIPKIYGDTISSEYLKGKDQEKETESINAPKPSTPIHSDEKCTTSEEFKTAFFPENSLHVEATLNNSKDEMDYSQVEEMLVMENIKPQENMNVE